MRVLSLSLTADHGPFAESSESIGDHDHLGHDQQAPDFLHDDDNYQNHITSFDSPEKDSNSATDYIPDIVTVAAGTVQLHPKKRGRPKKIKEEKSTHVQDKTSQSAVLSLESEVGIAGFCRDIV